MGRILIEDLGRVHSVSNVSISPDGRYTAYTVTGLNMAENRYDHNIHLKDNATGVSSQLTFLNKDRSFIWDCPETLLVMTGRAKADESSEIEERTCFYRLPIHGGEMCKAFELPYRVSAIKRVEGALYCVAAVVDLNRAAGLTDEERREELDYHVIEEVPVWGNGRGFVARKRTALFLFDEASGTCTKITPDLTDVGDFDVKGGSIAYTGRTWETCPGSGGGAFLYDTASQTTRTLLSEEFYRVGRIRLTDSGAVALATDLRIYGTLIAPEFTRMDFHSGKQTVTPMPDMAAGVSIMSDFGSEGQTLKVMGDELLFVGLRGFRAELYKLAVDGSVAKLFDFCGALFCFDAFEDGIDFIAAPENGCVDLHEYRGGSVRRATAVNDALFSKIPILPAKYLPFTNSDGVTIDGWVIEPFDYDPSKRYPGILEIHGGPRAAYGDAFYHEMQAMAGAGSFVFFCNPRGSEGRGPQFADLRGKFGAIDYDDCMAFTDHVLKLYPAIDPKRIGAGGGSYGGFMCNWIAGHTDRFAAIASQRCVSNWITSFLTSEIGIPGDGASVAADPWTDVDKMWDQSPLKYADRAKTPILFIHSLCDYNCTIDQGVQMFAAMRYFGVPSKMVLFEGENHGLSRTGKPRHRVRRLKEILGWFDQYLAFGGK